MFRLEFNHHENLVLRDITEPWYPRVMEFMKVNYFNKNPVFQKLQFFEDENIYRDYEETLLHCLRTESSVVAMSQNTEEIYAAAILKYNQHTLPMWRALSVILDEGKMAQLVRLHSSTIVDYYRKNSHTHPPDESSVHIFQYYVKDELKTPEFMFKFFEAISDIARHLKSPRLTYFAMTKQERANIKDWGFDKLTPVIYSLYKVEDTFPFSALRDMGEMTGRVYEKSVHSLVPYEDMPPHIDMRKPDENVGRSLNSK